LQLNYAVAIRSNHGVWLPQNQTVRQNRWRTFDRIFSDGSKQIRYIREIVFGKRREIQYWLIRNMGLRWSGGRFSFVDSTNEVVAFNPSAEDVGPSAFLISKAKLTNFLCENNFDLIWTVLGERQLIGGQHREWHGRLELSGAYQLRDGIVHGEPLNAWHKTPQES
jgi:hypothetical protein